MSRENTKSLAIACASGSFKGAFAHGVLSAEGLSAVYQHGEEKAKKFIARRWG